MNNQIVTVNLIPGLSAPAVVKVSQYDVGRPITFNVLDGASAASISSSMTVTVVGTKPSGLGFSQTAVIASLSTVTINTTLAMTQECGMIPAEIRFTQSGENVGTANFILAVEKTPHADGTTDGTYETMGDLQSQLNALDTRVDALEAGSGGSGLTDDIKTALLNCFAHVAWVDADGQDYYDALESALDSGDLSVSLTLSQVSSSNTATTVGYGESYTTTLTASTGYTLNTVSVTMGGVDITSTSYSSGTITIPSVTGNIVITATAVLAAQSITATYTQSGTVYTTDSLDSLKNDLVVTANYSGGGSATVPSTDYTLSGTLTEGTSTITVTYAGLTDTFTVNCTVKGWLYHFNESLLSSGSEDFGLTGTAVYATGRLGTDKAYSHIIPTSGDATSDTQYGLKVTGITRFPNFNGDFTISYWFKAQVNTGYMHPFYFTIYANTSNPPAMLTRTGGSWSVAANAYNSNKTAGIAMQGTATGQLMFRLTSGSLEGSAGVRLTIPSGFDPSAWHHYAITKKGSVYRVFVDGVLAFSGNSTYTTVYNSGQLALVSSFVQASGTASDLNQIPNGGLMQDFYVAEFCKWTEDFDPSTITY